MPVLKQQDQAQDPDAIARPVCALRISTQEERWERPWHSHRKARRALPDTRACKIVAAAARPYAACGSGYM